MLLALPMIFTPGRWLLVHVGMWAVVAFEEGVKAFASTREQNRIDRFWLISMFGIWELILDKAPGALFFDQPAPNGSALQIVGLLYATALPVLMHIVTAAVYAFAFERRVWAAFLVSWFVHLAFNEAVHYFDLSMSASLTETVVLVVLLVGIFQSKGPRASSLEAK